mgnify:CR=1 FL=1
MFAGDFAPFNWAFCEGQTLPVKSNPNPARYSIAGTIYGGAYGKKKLRDQFGTETLNGGNEQ